jgi:hypothetical protein
MAIVSLFHLFALIMLTASPDLHELIHHDADSSDHDCAVTVFLAGQVDLVVLDWVVRVAGERLLPAVVNEPSLVRFGSFFLGRRPLEHAPPLASGL